MHPRLFLIPLLVSSAGCSDAGEYGDAVGVDQAAATASAEASASSAKGKARNVSEETDAYFFEYSYPAEVGAYPELKAELDRQLEAERAQLVKDTAQWKAEAEAEGFEFRAHSSNLEWKVVADIPGWLSLSGDASSYTGGAHGNYGTVGLVYDKQAKTIREAIDLFRSPTAFWQSVSAKFCEKLDAERAKRRGEPVDPNDETFGTCPPIDDLVLLLGSSNGKVFDRVGIIANPYVAGAYAEGLYEIDLDVDARMVDAVKPEFASAFTIHR
ncbi:DUF4163 domain-containing protein [Qipengyuania marisflavi]|uniref:DUF4163 domain-containing protein n=1 Tax=Qipengyuania marisflavi TaxID=2486356 RepID=A0A5S3P6N9_9SPHN|nr:DUF4163 domain-containing protein [Qipengyuania marisflavi]TMM48785.1 DUF4163 domain-containing protein [Qipengyuania marisflavi]